MNSVALNAWRRGGLAAALAAALATASPAQAESIVGLTTTNALVVFDNSSPMFSSAPVAITGLLGANEQILGIDLRPATGGIYGLGSGGNLYTLNALTGAATFVGALAPFGGFAGTSFGFDFNPTVDRIRVTSNAGENLRLVPTSGAVIVDIPLSGATASLTAVAYSDNDNDPSTTTTSLYGINGATDTLYGFVGSPNVGMTTVIGALGVNTSNVAGFDISGATGAAYAALTDGDTGKSSLYRINLNTGAATLVGAFGFGGVTAGAPPLLDITVSPVPELRSYALLLAGLLGIGWVARRRGTGSLPG